MPRFFDDYSNTYLTHDSAAGRKQQRRGWKFRENFKLHYDKYLPGWRSGPMGLASAQQAFLRQTGLRPPLPDGWKEEFDEVTKASFYIHEESGERTWVRPGFLPPGFVGSGPMPPVVANSALNQNVQPPAVMAATAIPPPGPVVGIGMIPPPPPQFVPPPNLLVPGSIPPPPGSLPPPPGSIPPPGSLPPPPGSVQPPE